MSAIWFSFNDNRAGIVIRGGQAVFCSIYESTIFLKMLHLLNIFKSPEKTTFLSKIHNFNILDPFKDTAWNPVTFLRLQANAKYFDCKNMFPKATEADRPPSMYGYWLIAAILTPMYMNCIANFISDKPQNLNAISANSSSFSIKSLSGVKSWNWFWSQSNRDLVSGSFTSELKAVTGIHLIRFLKL